MTPQARYSIQLEMFTPASTTIHRSGLIDIKASVLTDDEVVGFLEESAMLSTTESFVLFASASVTFRTLRDRVTSGTLTGAAIEEFVEGILRGFQPGHAFYADKVLALIAQLVGSGPEPFAARYLAELAALDCAELPLSPRVARRVLRQRELSYSETSTSEFRFPERLYGREEPWYSSSVYPHPSEYRDPSVVFSAPLDWAA